MTQELGNLIFNIKTDNDQLEIGLKRAESSAKRSADTMADAFDHAFHFAQIYVGIKTLDLLTHSVIDTFIKFNSTLEQSSTAWTALFSNAPQFKDLGGGIDDLGGRFGMARQAASALQEELKKFAAITPFKYEDVDKAAHQLVNYGFAVKDLLQGENGLKGLIADIGNFAAAKGGNTGETIDRISLALGQIKSKGYALGQELRQLNEAGVGTDQIMQKIADQTGMTAGQINKLREEGKLTASDFISAFRAVSQEKFGEAIALQTKTFGGAMSTIQDSLQFAGAKAFEPIFQRISQLAIAIATFVNSEGFDKWATQVSAVVESVAQGVQFLWDIFTTGFNGILQVVSSVGQEIHDAFGWIDPFVPHSPPLVESVTQGVALIISQYQSLSEISDILTAVGGTVETFRMVTTSAWIEHERVVAVAKAGVLSAFGAEVPAAYLASIEGINGLVQSLGPLKDAISEQRPIVQALKNDLKDAQESLREAQNAVRDAEKDLRPLKEAVTTATSAYYPFESAVKSANDGLNDAKNAYKDAQGNLQELKNHLDDTKSSLESQRFAMTDLQNAVIDTGDAVDRMKISMRPMQDAIDQSSERISVMKDQLSQAKSALKDLFNEDTIQGSKEFRDKLYDVDQQMNQIKLQIERAKASGSNTNAYKGLTDSLNKLQAQAESMKLEQKLKLDPLKKQIEDVSRSAKELTPEEALTRGKSLAGTIERLQDSIDGETTKLDQSKNALMGQRDALRSVQEAHTRAQEAVTLSEQGLRPYISRMQEAEKAVRDKEAALHPFTEAIRTAEGVLARAEAQARPWAISLRHAQDNLDNANRAIDPLRRNSEELNDAMKDAQDLFDIQKRKLDDLEGGYKAVTSSIKEWEGALKDVATESDRIAREAAQAQKKAEKEDKLNKPFPNNKGALDTDFLKDSNDKLEANTKEFKIKVDAANAALLPFLTIVGDAMKTTGKVVQFAASIIGSVFEAIIHGAGELSQRLGIDFGKVGSVLLSFASVLLNVQFILWALTPIVNILVGTFALLISPIGLVAVALTALVVAYENNFARMHEYVEYYTDLIAANLTTFTDFTDSIGEAFGLLLSGNFAGAFSKVEEVVVPATRDLADLLGGWVLEEIPVFQANLHTMLDYVGVALQQIIPRVAGLIGILAFDLGRWIFNVIPQLALGLADYVTRVVGILGSIVAELVPVIASWVSLLAEWVVLSLPRLGSELLQLLNFIVSWVQSVFPILVNNVRAWADAFVDWVAYMLPVLASSLTPILTMVIDFIAANAPVLLHTITSEWLPALVNWLFTDAAPRLIDGLVQFLGVFGNWLISEGLPKLLALGGQLASALIGGLFEGLDKIGSGGGIADTLLTVIIPAIAGIATVIGGVFLALSEFSGVGAIIASVTTFFEGIVGVIGLIVAALGGPLTLAILAAGAVVALFIAAWMNDWGGIQEIVANVGDFLGTVFTTIGEWLGENLPKAGDALSATFSTLGDVLSAAFTALGPIIDFLSQHLDVVIPILLRIVAAFNPFGAAVLAVGYAVTFLAEAWAHDWGGIQETVEGAISFISDLIGTIFNEVIYLAASYVTDYMIPAIVALADFFETQLLPILSGVGGAFTDIILPALSDLWGFISDNILPIIGALIELSFLPLKLILEVVGGIISSVLTAAFGDLSDQMQDADGNAISPFKVAFDILYGVLSTVWEFLKDNLGPAFSAFGGFIKNDVLPQLEVLRSWFAEHILPVFREIKEWLDKINGISLQPKKLEVATPAEGADAGGAPFSVGALDTLGSSIGTKFSEIGASVNESITGISSGVGSAFDTLGTDVNSSLNSLSEDAGDKFSKLGSETNNALSEVTNNAGSLFDALGTNVNSSLTSLSEGAGDKFSKLGSETNNALSEATTNAGSAFDTLGTNVNSILSTVASDIGNKFDEIGTNTDNFLANLKDNAGQKLEEFKETVLSAYDSLPDGVKDAVDLVVSGLSELTNAATTGDWSTVQSNISTNLDIVKQIASDKFEEAKSLMMGVWDSMPDDIKADIELIVSTIQTRVANIGPAFDNLGTEVRLKITDVKNAVGDTFSEIGTTAQNIATDVKNSIGDAFSGLGTLAHDVILAIGEGFNQLGIIAQSIATDIKNSVGDAFSGLGTFVQDGIIAIGDVFNSLGTTVRAIVTDLKNFVGDAFDSLGTYARIVVTDLKNDVGNLFDELGTNTRIAFTNIKNAVGDAFDELGTNAHAAATNIKNSVGDTFDELGTSARNVATTVKNDVGNAFEEFGTNVRAGATLIKDTVGDAFDELGTRLRTTATDIKNDVGNKFDELGTNVQATITFVKNFVGDSFDNLGTYTRESVTTLKNDVGGLFDELGTDLRTIVTNVKNDVGTIFDALGTNIRTVMTDAKNIVVEKFEDIKTWLGEQKDKFIEAAKNIGSAFLLGIAQGILDTRQWLIDQFLDSIRGVLAAIKFVLGIASPSSVAAEEIGAPFVMGLIQGLQGKVKELLDTGTDMAFNLVKGILNGLESQLDKVDNVLALPLKEAVRAAKTALGIRSPSSVTEKEIGVPMMQGVIAGIQGQAKNLSSIFTNSAVGTVVLAHKAVSGAIDLGSFQVQDSIGKSKDTLTSAASDYGNKVSGALAAANGKIADSAGKISGGFSRALGKDEKATPGASKSDQDYLDKWLKAHGMPSLSDRIEGKGKNSNFVAPLPDPNEIPDVTDIISPPGETDGEYTARMAARDRAISNPRNIPYRVVDTDFSVTTPNPNAPVVPNTVPTPPPAPAVNLPDTTEKVDAATKALEDYNLVLGDNNVLLATPVNDDPFISSIDDTQEGVQGVITTVDQVPGAVDTAATQGARNLDPLFITLGELPAFASMLGVDIINNLTQGIIDNSSIFVDSMRELARASYEEMHKELFPESAGPQTPEFSVPGSVSSSEDDGEEPSTAVPIKKTIFNQTINNNGILAGDDGLKILGKYAMEGILENLKNGSRI